MLARAVSFSLAFARCTAQKTRSGVAGLSRAIGPEAPKAAIASRIASRTDIASIKGGSPTALLPKTTPGSLARDRNETRKSAGISDQEGSLYVEAPFVATLPSLS